MIIDAITSEFDEGSDGRRSANWSSEPAILAAAWSRPQCAAWERERRVPVDALRAAAAAGLCGVEVPVSLRRIGHAFLGQAADGRGAGAP